MEISHLRAGTLLQGGKYRIIRFLSSGGFGCTYEAEHTLLRSHVAIKEFFVKDYCNRDEATSSVSIATESKRDLVEKLKKKFIEEAQALFKMHNDGIVRVIDIFQENGTAYYVMDYIEGRSLHDIVKQQGPLDEQTAIGYILQVCKALEYVHSFNRLHLDIKPGNIMVDRRGKVTLIDFGASKHYSEENGENTSTLLGVNTSGYAPVEQSLKSFTTFSPATDIYALGATLYKLLTGITPPDSVALMSEEERLRPLPQTISYNTRRVVMKAMSLRRKDRYQTVRQFADALQGRGDTTSNSADDAEVTSFTSVEPPVNNVADQPRQKPVTSRPSYSQKEDDDDDDNGGSKHSGIIKFILIVVAVLAVILLLEHFAFSAVDGNMQRRNAEYENNVDDYDSVASDSEPEVDYAAAAADSSTIEGPEQRVEKSYSSEENAQADDGSYSGSYSGDMAGFPIKITIAMSQDGSYYGTYKNVKYGTVMRIEGEAYGDALSLKGTVQGTNYSFYLQPQGDGMLTGSCTANGTKELSVRLQKQ